MKRNKFLLRYLRRFKKGKDTKPFGIFLLAIDGAPGRVGIVIKIILL